MCGNQRFGRFSVGLFFSLLLGTETAAAAPASWGDVAALPSPAPGKKISYGPGPLQFGELRVPDGKGLFPVVVVIHGGCWLSDFDYGHVRPLAAAIAQQGFATWTIEFRRLGDDGGGWPGTFHDVGMAIDKLQAIAQSERLDRQRIILLGHSSGGHLALWAAGRSALTPKDALFQPGSSRISAVIGLAPIVDLASYRIGPARSCHGSVDQLLGGSPTEVPVRYAAASPRERLPLGVPQYFIQGDADLIVDPKSVESYSAAATAAGDSINLQTVKNAGHFDDVIPGSSTWPAVLTALHSAAARTSATQPLGALPY